MSARLIRVRLSIAEAAVIVAALSYWRDTYLDDEDDPTVDQVESTALYLVAERVEFRHRRALDRQGVRLESGEPRTADAR